MTRILTILFFLTTTFSCLGQLFGQNETTYIQADLIGIKPFLIQSANSSSAYTKRFCNSNDSIMSSEEKWINNYPINVWFDWEPFKKTIRFMYSEGKTSQLLIENIYDTTGLKNLCSQMKPSSCYLFRGYCDSYPIKNDLSSKYNANNWEQVTNWIILFQFDNDKSLHSTTCEIWDSTSFYVEVLKNPIFKYEYGFACYYEGAPPLGRYAMSYLRRKNKMNIINNFTECKNNEGLMFIVEYYIRQNLPLPDGFEKALSKKIYYCDGCTDSGTMTIAKMIKEFDNDSTSFGVYIKEGH